MSGMVRQMLQNAELREENFALRASNAELMAENAVLMAENASLRKRFTMASPSSTAMTSTANLPTSPPTLAESI
jgi:regulator of replication initiation timing